MRCWIDLSEALSGGMPWARPRADALVFTLAITVGISSCASGPSEKDRLPDVGPTTLQIYEQHLGGEIARPVAAPSSSPATTEMATTFFEREGILPHTTVPSRRGHQALTDLQEDFQRIHNPDIIGYVYPHVAGDLPVPGYYTVFPLREVTHYAQPGEGSYGETRP